MHKDDYKSIEVLEFIAWEKETDDCIDLKRVYIDVVDGDFLAALLLSQIIYWFLPDSKDKPKVKVLRDEKYWLCKKRADWKNEIRITKKQYDKAAGVLEKLGLIERGVRKFNNETTCSISLNMAVLMKKIKEKKAENSFSGAK